MTKSQIFAAAHAAARRASGLAYRTAFAAGLRAAYAALKAPRPLTAVLAALPQVERVAAWNDRHYVNLAAARGSRANADLRTKIWLRGDVLTIETGKGYHSDAFIAAKYALIAAAEAAGATIRAL